MGPPVRGDQRRARPLGRYQRWNVHRLERRVQVRQGEQPRVRGGGQAAALGRREVDGHGHLVGQRALGEQHVRAARPLAERRVPPGVAGVDDAPPAPDHGICHTLVGVRNLARRDRHAVRQVERLVRGDLADREREARDGEPLPERRRHPLQQGSRADGPHHDERRLARRDACVAPGEDEAGEVGDVVGVEVRDRHVRHPPPVEPPLGHPPRDPRAAVHQQPHLARLHEVTGAGPGGVERDGARAEGR